MGRDFPGGPVKILPSSAGGAGSIPGEGSKILYASQTKNQNIKPKQYCNKFNRDFKNGPHQKKILKKKNMFLERELLDTLIKSFITIFIFEYLTHWGCSVIFESELEPFYVICSVSQFSRSVMSNSLRPHGLQHARLPCPSPAPETCSNSCSSSRWCQPTISSSVVPFSSCPQSFPASGSLQMSQLFASGGQSIGVSASASVLPMNT